MALYPSADVFARRHIGPSVAEIQSMLAALGVESLDALVDQVVPDAIRLRRPLSLPEAKSEQEALDALTAMAAENEIWRSYLGLGYHAAVTPPVIRRNILENPGWYTAYTHYQAEISQGRLEMLLNYQTLIRDLTGLEIANASLLDEGTAAAEAMTMAHRLHKGQANAFFVLSLCHPQTIAVVCTRAVPLGLEVIVGDHRTFDFSTPIFGALLQYPATDGSILDYSAFVEAAHADG